MDIVDYSPRSFSPRSFARRDEDLVVVNEEQSAIPFVHHAWIHEYYAVMLLVQFENNPPPPNIELSVYDPTPITLYTRGRQQHVRTTPDFTLKNNRRYGGNWGAWLAIVTTYLGMCALLVAFIQLKFENETGSPFHTHLGFIVIYIASLFMTLTTSGIVVYTNNNLGSLMKKHFSPVFEFILKTLFWFSFINTPLSLLLLLFIPQIYNWTGYVMVCALFLTIIAVKFRSLKWLLAAQRGNNLGAFEMV